MSEASTTPYGGFDDVFAAGKGRAGRSGEAVVWAAMLPQEWGGVMESAGFDLSAAAAYKTLAAGSRRPS